MLPESKSIRQANAKQFKLTNAKGKEIPIRVYYSHKERKDGLMMVVSDIVDTDIQIQGNTEYTLTIGEDLQATDGTTLGHEETIEFRTLDQSRSTMVYTIMMIVMIVGMIFFSMRSAKKAMEKENDQKQKKDTVNPYTVSYTHLDVYKRQLLPFSSILLRPFPQDRHPLKLFFRIWLRPSHICFASIIDYVHIEIHVLIPYFISSVLLSDFPSDQGIHISGPQILFITQDVYVLLFPIDHNACIIPIPVRAVVVLPGKFRVQASVLVFYIYQRSIIGNDPCVEHRQAIQPCQRQDGRQDRYDCDPDFPFPEFSPESAKEAGIFLFLPSADGYEYPASQPFQLLSTTLTGKEMFIYHLP